MSNRVCSLVLFFLLVGFSTFSAEPKKAGLRNAVKEKTSSWYGRVVTTTYYRDDIRILVAKKKYSSEKKLYMVEQSVCRGKDILLSIVKYKDDLTFTTAPASNKYRVSVVYQKDKFSGVGVMSASGLEIVDYYEAKGSLLFPISDKALNKEKKISKVVTGVMMSLTNEAGKKKK